MLNVDFWLEELKTRPPEEVILGIQQDVLSTCRIIAGQLWRKNSNGQSRSACLSLIKSIKVLEGEQENEDEQ
jgi:hypothetical protein